MKKDQLHIFKTIFNHSPISTQIFSPDGETVLVNRAWEELWQISFKKMGSYNVLRDDQLVKLGIMPYIIRGFSGETVSVPAIKYQPQLTTAIKDSVEYRWVSAKMYPIIDQQGEVIYTVLQHKDVTEKYEAEEEKKKLISLVNTSSEIIGIFREDLSISYLNNLGKVICKQTKKKSSKKLFTQFFDQQFVTFFKQSIWEELKQKGKWTGEVELTNSQTNERITALCNIYALQNHRKDEEREYAFVARDITKIKHGQEIDARLAAIVESSDDAIISKNLDGIIKSWNKGATRLFGYSVKEAIGKHITLIIPEKSQYEEVEIINKIKAGKRIRHFQTVRQTKDGRYIDVSLSISPIKDATGKIIGASKISRDISKEKRSFDQLRDSEERLRFALAAGNIGVWDWDITKNSITWTDNVYKIHGVNKKAFEVTFENFISLIHPEDRAAVTEAIDQSVQGKKDFSIEFRVIDPSGRIRWITSKADVSVDQNQTPIRMLGATSDITYQKMIEQEKSDFLSMASHELKTPITSIRMFTDLLERHLRLRNYDESEYFASRIKDQMERLTELTNDLLDVSRIETGKFILKCKPCDLPTIVKDTIEQLQATTKHSILLSFKGTVIVNADQYRIYQVLVNLLTNAIKYSPVEKEIHVTILQTDTDAVVSVQDFGIGISKEKHSKIFDRLYQVAEPSEKTFPGLGLGLFISKEIIDRHHGKIWIESDVGKGSTFFFSLPLFT